MVFKEVLAFDVIGNQQLLMKCNDSDTPPSSGVSDIPPLLAGGRKSAPRNVRKHLSILFQFYPADVLLALISEYLPRGYQNAWQLVIKYFIYPTKKEGVYEWLLL